MSPEDDEQPDAALYTFLGIVLAVSAVVVSAGDWFLVQWGGGS